MFRVAAFLQENMFENDFVFDKWLYEDK